MRVIYDLLPDLIQVLLSGLIAIKIYMLIGLLILVQPVI